MVNGGGAITLQFQRSPFRPVTRTVFVPWNQIIVLPPVQMNLVDESDSTMLKVAANIAYSFLNSLQYKFYDGNSNDSAVICPDQNHELLRPILTSTWMPNAIGSMAGRSAIFAENQVSPLFIVTIILSPQPFCLYLTRVWSFSRDKFGDLINCIFIQSNFILVFMCPALLMSFSQSIMYC